MSSKAQHPYFHTPINEIERTAKQDGFVVEIEIIDDNTIYYLTKDSIHIRIGYTKDMLLPAYIYVSQQ